MLKISVFLVLLGIGTQAKLQAWHRKGCPLVYDLTPPLSNIVARNLNLSSYYWNGTFAKVLKIKVNALAFRNLSNNQAIAIMKFVSGYCKRRYFFVLLENCVAGYNDKEKKKLFEFQLNTTTYSKPEFYCSLNEAKTGAAEFENKGKWTEYGHEVATDVKTNTRKYIEFVLGVVFFPISLIKCLVDPDAANNETTYYEVYQHWKLDWKADEDYKIESKKGDVFIINGAVYKLVK